MGNATSAIKNNLKKRFSLISDGMSCPAGPKSKATVECRHRRLVLCGRRML
jgi:hypothetical protein